MIRLAAIRIPEYRYEARIDRWVDADTAILTVYLGSRIPPIDLGFNLIHTVSDTYRGSFRLFGINAPERNREGGTEATQFALALVPVGTTVEILSSKDPDSFGRYIAEMYLLDGTTFSKTMIAAGHAVVYKDK